MDDEGGKKQRNRRLRFGKPEHGQDQSTGENGIVDAPFEKSS